MNKIKLLEASKKYDCWHTEKYMIGDFKPSASDVLYYNWLLNIMKVSSGKRILDVACGKGYFLKEAMNRGLDISGVELSAVAVSKANQLLCNKVVVGVAETLEYPDSSFDYVTCIGSLEHFFEQERAIREFSRVVKDGGVILIVVPNLMFIGHIYMAFRNGVMPSEGEQEFSEVFKTFQGWKNTIEGNGLKIKRVIPYNYIHSSPKISIITAWMWRNILYHFVPFNLSYSFVILCRRDNHV